MGVSPRRAGIALLLLFTVSGFAALIYQSVWTHYLGLTLGHAAYAQSLVLAIFHVSRILLRRIRRRGLVDSN